MSILMLLFVQQPTKIPVEFLPFLYKIVIVPLPQYISVIFYYLQFR